MKYIYFAIITSILFLNIPKVSLAGQGDTIKILAHQNVLWDWYGSKDKWVKFPKDTTRFEKIIMKYTLGCPSTGCSQWDYTTKIEAAHHTGKIDSILVQAPNFRVNGNIVDSFKYKLDTTWVTFYDTSNMLTDSFKNQSSKVYLFTNPTFPLVVTDSFNAWPAGYYNYYFDNNGNKNDSLWVGIDNSLYLVYTPTYKKFAVVENIELGRIITPYAGNFPNNWQWTWYFDVTDYAPILKDSVNIRAFYGGWQNGFTVSLSFDFIEGIPPRDAIKVENIYSSGMGGFPYGISSNPIESYLTPKQVPVSPLAVNTKLKVTQSGHSFGGNLNCAEFCAKNYYINVNGAQQFSQQVWRDDCGMNPLYPQAGTWLYDRSAWCPGDKTLSFEHELTPFVTPGTTATIDMDMDPYTYSGGASFDPNYIIEAQLISYKAPNFTNDVAVIDIIAPNKDQNHLRFNPICGSPVIVIRNTGTAELKSLKINYRVEGGTVFTHNWTGNLKFMESETVALPPMTGDFTQGGKFFVTVYEPNGTADQYTPNSTMTSVFGGVPVIEQDFIVYLLTNKAANENSYEIKDINGNVVFSRNNLSNQTTYRDTLALVGGCYEFVFKDTGKDGLAFFANSDGNGQLRFMKPAGGIYKTFNADFGTETRYQFFVNRSSGVKDHLSQFSLEVYPNPASDEVNIYLNATSSRDFNVRIFNNIGQLVLEKKSTEEILQIRTAEYPKGFYTIMVESDGQMVTKKLLIQ